MADFWPLFWEYMTDSYLGLENQHFVLIYGGGGGTNLRGHPTLANTFLF